MKSTAIVFAWLIAMHLCSSFTWGAPIQWTIATGGNDHYYEATLWTPSDTNRTWTQARNIAAARTFNGLPGHLVTITSEAENTIAGNQLSDFGMDSFWLGGYQDHSSPSYSEPAGGWRWLTTEPWSYTAWFPGFPDEYQHRGQDYLRGIGHGLWDDIEHSYSESLGYIVEFQAVPEPSAFVLADLALVGLLVASRRHRLAAGRDSRPRFC